MKQANATLGKTHGNQVNGRTIGQRIRQILADSAVEWKISERALKGILVVPFLIALSGVVAALMGKEAYKMFTGEDKIAETLQVIGWIISLVLTISIARKNKAAGDRVITVLYLILAGAIIFMIGEEVSWGQRIFGWTTPETYAEINKQHETNLHNIYGVGSTLKWLHMLVGAYGTFLPLLLFFSIKEGDTRRFLAKLVPPLSLIPFFFLPFIWRLYRNLFDAPKRFYFVISEYSEVMELVLVSGFVFFLIFQFRQFGERRSSTPS